MSSYLITGCSRGIGLELVKQLIAAPSSKVSTVFATARGTSPSPALAQTIDSSSGRGHFVPLDVTDESSIAAATKQVSQHLGEKGLDVLINNAGIQASGAETITEMPDLEKVLATNVVAVHKVSSAFLPLLSKGADKKLVNITSTLGSVALKDVFAFAPVPSYKISKAALNMLTAQYSLELGPKGFIVFCLSPGNLQTDLGGAEAELSVATGAAAVLEVVYGATERDNGAFRNIYIAGNENYDGTNPPW